jgi:hypothetical protein
VQLIWWLGIVVVFIGFLLVSAAIISCIPPGWQRRLNSLERGRAAQGKESAVP